MEFPFFQHKRETPASLRQKAEELLAQALDESRETKGRFMSGENRLKRAGFEGDFRQYRPYNDSDRPQDIDWKRSARSDDILVREREKNQQRLLDLYIQNHGGMHFSSSPKLSTKYEISSLLGLTLALWSARHHNPIRFGSAKTSIDDLADVMLAQKQKSSPQWTKDSITVLIGDYTGPMQDIEQELSSLNSNTVLFMQILDPAELELSYEGRHVFEDGHHKITVNQAESMRNDYKSALNAHIKDLKKYCRRRNSHYQLVRTDQNLASVLNKALAAIGEKR
ncbi:MAG: hypothetical protein DI586_04810 [Micavibrio aeruginosavorus]|uniref:DUF58 domain-containing protein n=1 Tax=Micavibrio aeruginosavorus TaxID=349221 RepID=A0A2W5FQI3_9BACT|nr:MAG: hypothetical protein DI586_04810 [Micavibrio aeruginosavorus]